MGYKNRGCEEYLTGISGCRRVRLSQFWMLMLTAWGSCEGFSGCPRWPTGRSPLLESSARISLSSSRCGAVPMATRGGDSESSASTGFEALACLENTAFVFI